MKYVKNENSLSDNSNYLLYNVTNYKLTIDNSVTEILTKFASVILEYMKFISEKITVKNKHYYKFIFERGIETIIHVFSMIFYYTKNLDLTFYHTQKAYYFYIEFIEQISDENITFLQLSSKDAILFVYKKTIFDLNNDYRKNIPDHKVEETNILDMVDDLIYIYKIIVQFIINHKEFDYNNKINYITSACISIKSISEVLNKNKIKKNYIECIYLFINVLVDKDKNVGVNEFFKVLDEFVKKLVNKKKIDETLIKNKIIDTEINAYIENKEFDKLLDWICV